jgi:flagellin-like protein
VPRSSFRGDEAVSPVIGTILMVAITVVIAAVVFVFVSGFDEPANAPAVSVSADDLDDRLVFIRADPDLKSDDFEIRISVAGGFGYNEAAANVGPTDLAAFTFVPVGPDSLELGGGDSIFLCADSPAQDVQVALRHRESVTMVYEETFVTMRGC